MNITEKYTLEIHRIKQIICDLKNGHIYEADPVIGVPKCSTMGENLEKEFDLLIEKIEKDQSGDIELVANILSK